MNKRKQGSSVDNQNNKQDRVVAASAVITPPSQDEEAFLQKIEKDSEGYNPKVMVGGPSNFSA